VVLTDCREAQGKICGDPLFRSKMFEISESSGRTVRASRIATLDLGVDVVPDILTPVPDCQVGHDRARFVAQDCGRFVMIGTSHWPCSHGEVME